MGFDSANQENLSKIRSADRAEFAEGDDDDRADRIGPDDLGIDLRFDVPPAEAIDYFRRKKVLKPDDFFKLEREARAGAFSISDVYDQDVLQAFHEEITSALQDGRSQQTVVRRFKQILNGAGHEMLGDFHLESIFRTNMQVAYGVGRRLAMEDVVDYLPFWELVAVGDDRTRPTHDDLSGSVYPADNAFWDSHYPPYDFNCRCSVIARFDYPAGYDHGRTYKENPASNFTGIPRNPSLENTLKNGAQRALESRQK